MFLKLLQEFRLGFHLGLKRVWESVGNHGLVLEYVHSCL